VPPAPRPVTAAQVRRDFNDLRAVVHYAKAAHRLGLWASERIMIERTFPDLSAPLLEAGCGAGRVCVAMHELGYSNLTAFDFAQELVDQAVALAAERKSPITIHHADATKLTSHPAFRPPVEPVADRFPVPPRQVRVALNVSSSSTPQVSGLRPQPSPSAPLFAGCLFMFNGLMQIPLRRNRRRALRQLAAVCAPGAPLLFTTHDRDHSPAERASWRYEARRWAAGKQDPRLREFGDRRFEDHCGDTFMHLPDRAEILADLAATGWLHVEDHLRRDLAKESRPVREFSDECRFWVAHRAA
jgi:SAM-dependent methyltransferase